MRKAARPSGGVVSSNPRRWMGERLHHHGGGVCGLFVLLWIDSLRHELIVCKKWYKNNPKEGLRCCAKRDENDKISRLPALKNKLIEFGNYED
jgi:hypothetical protein